MSQVATWLLNVASSLYSNISNWGYIGLGIIAFPILRKLVNLAKSIFHF